MPAPPPSCSFYPSTVYLSTSKLAVAVLGNMALASALLVQGLLVKARDGQMGRCASAWGRARARERACPALRPLPHPPQLFLGDLRDIEVEMVRERLSSAIMESLLALTVFRDEFGARFVAMFGALVFIKVLHWLVQDRVEYIEVTPSVSRLQHARIACFMGLLLVRAPRGCAWP